MHYDGELTVYRKGHWRFQGVAHFEDFWDFDPKPFLDSSTRRPAFAELRVRVAHHGLAGQPFQVTSVVAPMTQNSTDSIATFAGEKWTGGSGADVMFRSAGDIAGGGIVGDASTLNPDVGGDYGVGDAGVNDDANQE